MHKRRGIAAAMLGVMLTVSVLPADVDLAAAVTPKLSKKSVTVKKGKSVTVTLKKSKVAKKIKWKIANKKVATVKAKKKGKAVVRGKKAGKTKLNCQFVLRGKKKKLFCKVIVKLDQNFKDPVTIADKTPSVTVPSAAPVPSAPVPSSVPDQTKVPDTTNLPITDLPQASSPSATAEPTVEPTLSPTDPPESPSPIPTSAPTAEPPTAPTQKPSEPTPTSTAVPTTAPTQRPSEPTPTATAIPTSAPTGTPVPAEQGVILDNDYSEGSTGGFAGRGDAKVQPVTDSSIASIPVLAVTGRTASWQGAQTDAAGTLEAGKSYSVSTAVYQKAADSTQLKFTLSYKITSRNLQP